MVHVGVFLCMCKTKSICSYVPLKPKYRRVKQASLNSDSGRRLKPRPGYFAFTLTTYLTIRKHQNHEPCVCTSADIDCHIFTCIHAYPGHRAMHPLHVDLPIRLVPQRPMHRPITVQRRELFAVCVLLPEELLHAWCM
jgi:hypothetical protein